MRTKKDLLALFTYVIFYQWVVHTNTSKQSEGVASNATG